MDVRRRRTEERIANDRALFEARLARARARLSLLREEPGMVWRLWEVDGYFVPYVRVGRERDTDRVNRYHASQNALGFSAGQARGEGQPIQGPVEFVALVVRRSRRGDASNLLKALEDAGNGILYNDDKQITLSACLVVRPPADRVGDFAEVWYGARHVE